jgi:hypothetical protein
MTSEQFAKAQYDYYIIGREFFAWFNGKNTPNILEMIGHQLGAIEVALKLAANRRVAEMSFASSAEIGEITATISRHLAEGWEPYGNLTVDSGGEERKYVQAMVKYADKPA